MKYRITDSIDADDEKAVFNGLLAYNLQNLEDSNIRDLGVYYESGTGGIAAGLIGCTHGNWLHVKYLWVGDGLRGQGIGGMLLKQAEDTAGKRGCKYVFLDTFHFQAPEFYRKKGYRKVFTLEEYPLTGKRHYYVKTL